MKKRGSHVGMILSFVIFITFIVFLYGVMKPTLNTGQDKKSLIGYIETQMIKNVTSNLTTISVQITENKNPNSDCIYLNDFFSTVTTYVPSPLIIVKNETGNIQEVYHEYPNSIGSLVVNRKIKNNIFFKVYYSSQFNGLSKTTIPCQKVNTNDYTIGSITLDKYIFEKMVLKFNQSYTDDYEQLKNDLKIPPGSEFEFIFKKADGGLIEPNNDERIKPDQVYVEETPIQYMDNQANVQSGFISIKVW